MQYSQKKGNASKTRGVNWGNMNLKDWRTFMIGSSSLTAPLRIPSLKAALAAVWKASTLESTSWKEPSYNVVVTSTTGKPARVLLDIISSTPCQIAAHADSTGLYLCMRIAALSWLLVGCHRNTLQLQL